MMTIKEYMIKYAVMMCKEEGSDPNDPEAVTKVIQRMVDDPKEMYTFAQQYEEYEKAYKDLEEDQKEWDDFWKKQEEYNRDYIRDALNPIRIDRIKQIYRSLCSIFDSWNGRIQKKTDKGIQNMKTHVAFEQDTVYICMKMAAADKEVTESEAGIINDIIGANHTPLEYYEFYKKRKTRWKMDVGDPFDALTIAILIDLHEGEKGKLVNEENVRYFFLELAKTVLAIDGKRDDSEAQLLVKMEDELKKLCSEIRRTEYHRDGISYKIPEGYTGSIRID